MTIFNRLFAFDLVLKLAGSIADYPVNGIPSTSEQMVWMGCLYEWEKY